jgi:hypothetical protein
LNKKNNLETQNLLSKMFEKEKEKINEESKIFSSNYGFQNQSKDLKKDTSSIKFRHTKNSVNMIKSNY